MKSSWSYDDQLELMRRQAAEYRGRTRELWAQAGIQAGSRVADLGCGPGYTTLDLLELVAERGEIFACDLSEEHLQQLRKGLGERALTHVQVHRVDLDREHLPGRDLDAVTCRWVTYYLKRPEFLLQNIWKALKPGGTFVMIDFFSMAYHMVPESPAFRRLVKGIDDFVRSGIGDLETVRRLPGLMAKQGFIVEEIRSYQDAVRPGTEQWKTFELAFSSFTLRLRKQNLWTEDEASAFWQEWRERAADPGAYFLTLPEIGVIGRKPG